MAEDGRIPKLLAEIAALNESIEEWKKAWRAEAAAVKIADTVIADLQAQIQMILRH